MNKNVTVLRPILGAIAGYLLFNLAIRLGLGSGGIFALAGANILGGGLTAAAFRRQLSGRPNWPVAILGSLGILVIVGGLRAAHHHLPASLAMETVYNCFAVVSWPLFLGLNRLWPTHFGERPNRFDLVCHVLMAGLVYINFTVYPKTVKIDAATVGAVALAVAGYAAFNAAIKLAKGHRPTTVVMNLIGGAFLLTTGLITHEPLKFSWVLLAGLILGGVAILLLVHQLGESYKVFGAKGHAPLVAPLVYDGVLVARPTIMPLTGEQVSLGSLVIALGMLVVTALRYRHHTHGKS